MANINGAETAIPGVYSNVYTQSRGVSVPGGRRVASIVGEGERVERLVAYAIGGGSDGLDPTYSSTTGSDGRHFALTYAPVISNRTSLYKNGVLLNGIESANFHITGPSTFSSVYDYRIDITYGYIELQAAYLIDQGGSYFVPGPLNVGDGVIQNLSLIDANAPSETWTVRCVSTVKDTFGNPIDGYGRFIATGSVSGNVLDGYGQIVVWQSNGVVKDNTILSFGIAEGSFFFHEGDYFQIKVEGGALIAGDTLTAYYIAEADLNDPEYFTDVTDLNQKHGAPSLENRLSLGAQLFFASTPPGVWAVQAAPSVPRRVSYELEASASGSATEDDLIFTLPLNVIPDHGTGINFFVTDYATQVETQIVPNKVDYYDPIITANPLGFLFGPSYAYSYTVIMETGAVTKEGDDGVLTAGMTTYATLSSDTVTFDLTDITTNMYVQILSPALNAGTYKSTAVASGVITIYNLGGFVAEPAEVEFRVLDTSTSSARILFTSDLALSSGNSLRATVVDTKDADFFDVNWTLAFDALELVECDIIVPLPLQTISAIFQVARAHCEAMSNIKNRKERIAFIGAINGLTPDNVMGNELAAVEDIGILEGIQGDDISEILSGNTEDLADYSVSDAYSGTFRVVYFYPDQIVVQIGADRTVIDGFFMAAAAAGWCTATPNIAIPLTNKILPGFTILNDRMFKTDILEDLAAAGITVLQPVSGGGIVIWGKTTTGSGYPEEEEISIIFIRDRIAKVMRKAFSGFPGNPAGDTFQGSLIARANGVVQSFIPNLITDYADLKVVRDKVEPRQWNVSVSVQPVYSCNWIQISIGVGLL